MKLGLTPVSRLRAGINHERPEPEDRIAVTAMDEYRRRLTGGNA